MVLLRGRVTPGQRDVGPYVYLPFEVPAGTAVVKVRYEFEEGSILDLGLLDPTATAFPSEAGFRGWSGSARREVFVAGRSATPGYVAGAPQAGTWQVVLGLARVAADGCDYRVEVELGTVEPHSSPGSGAYVVPPPPSGRAPAGSARPEAKGEAHWYPGDLQSHTFHSDARGSIVELADEAARNGLRFLAVTDHNTCSHHGEIARLGRQVPMLVGGEEVTTYWGHANVWGVDGWVDFRVLAASDLDLLVRHVHERGGVLSLNHPKVTPDCIGCDWEWPVPAGIDAFEAWQGPWPLKNWESLERYDALLRTGRRVTLVGGSDRHHPGASSVTDPRYLQAGTPTTWLRLEHLTPAAVVDAVRSGEAFVTEGPNGPTLSLSVGGAGMGGAVAAGEAVTATATVRGAEGDLLVWVSDTGTLREAEVTSDDFEDRWTWLPAGKFVRVEVVARASRARLGSSFGAALETICRRMAVGLEELAATPWRRALSNPVYVTEGAPGDAA